MSNGLGRGLSSLIPQKTQKVTSVKGDAVVDAAAEVEKNKILWLAPEKIKANKSQPRKSFNEARLSELADSIKQYGIIQPLVVCPSADGYELIAGERRLRAAKMIGLKEVPAIVREAKEQEKLEVALIENIQRQDLNPIETALAYRKLLDEFNLTKEDLAKRVGKSRPVVSNALRLLNLPGKIQDAVVKGAINEGHAIVIAGLDSEDKQMALFKKVTGGGLTFHQTLNETRRMGGTKEARIKVNYQDKDRENTLKNFFGARVQIARKKKGGQIIVDFYSDDELEEIIKKAS